MSTIMPSSVRSLLGAALYPLAGCGHHSDGQAGGTTTGAPDVVGTWASSCISTQASQAVFGSTSVTETVTVYTDATCTTTAAVYVTTASSYTVGAATAGLADTWDFDRIIASVTVTFTTAAADTASANNTYGKADWVAGETVDVSGKKYDAKSTAECAAGSTVYSLLRVQGDELSGGDYSSGDGLSEATRPTKTLTVYYQRQ